VQGEKEEPSEIISPTILGKVREMMKATESESGTLSIGEKG